MNEVVVIILRHVGIHAKVKSLKTQEARKINLDRGNIRAYSSTIGMSTTLVTG